MINKEIIEGLREYLKDHYVPSLELPETTGMAAAKSFRCEGIRLAELREVDECVVSEYHSVSFFEEERTSEKKTSLRSVSNDA